jgi:hypothetical protein
MLAEEQGHTSTSHILLAVDLAKLALTKMLCPLSHPGVLMPPQASPAVTMSASSSAGASFEEVKQLLEKKATFLRGCRVLAGHCGGPDQRSFAPLVTRVHTLLRTRHTSTEAWRAGEQVFAAAGFGSGLTEARAFLNEAQEVEHDGPPTEQQQPIAALAAMEGFDPVDVLLGLVGPAQLRYMT